MENKYKTGSSGNFFLSISVIFFVMFLISLLLRELLPGMSSSLLCNIPFWYLFLGTILTGIIGIGAYSRQDKGTPK
jgi:hypothetical protein